MKSVILRKLFAGFSEKACYEPLYHNEISDFAQAFCWFFGKSLL